MIHEQLSPSAGWLSVGTARRCWSPVDGRLRSETHGQDVTRRKRNANGACVSGSSGRGPTERFRTRLALLWVAGRPLRVGASGGGNAMLFQDGSLAGVWLFGVAGALLRIDLSGVLRSPVRVRVAWVLRVAWVWCFALGSCSFCRCSEWCTLRMFVGA